MTAVHQVLTGLSVIAIAGAGFRLASLAAPRGLARAVATATLSAAMAALEALLLGLVGLGTDPAALVSAAALTWAIAWRLLPSPALGAGEELVAWWQRPPVYKRLILGASVGVGAAWAAWLLRYPALGSDSLSYHVPEIVEWVHSGRPGSVGYYFPFFSVGNYPVTNEVLVAWGSGISRSFLVIGLWAPLAMLLLATAGWMGLRSLRVEGRIAGLGVAAICLTPVLSHWQMNGVYTDLPSMAWLVSAAALSAASVERPALLAPAIVAAGLSVGTKTTTLPLAGLALAAGLYVNRSHLRGLVRPLTIATATALAVGGYWYLRNLVDHGSPFWPLLWGETVPFRTQGVDDSFLDRFRTAFDAFSREGVDLLAGGMVLILAAMLAPIFARTRETVISAIATSVSLLSWLNAPYTGTLTIATLRYLLPTLAVATLTVALAGRSRRGRPYALATLAVAAALNAWQTLRLGFPRVPGLDIVAAGAVLGTLAAGAAVAFAPRLPAPSRPWSVRASLVVGGAALAALLSPAASGFVDRSTRTLAEAARRDGAPAPAAVRWITAQPAFEGSERWIGFSFSMQGLLAGDRLQHRLELLSQQEDCAKVRSGLRAGWFVAQPPVTKQSIARRCLASEAPRFSRRGIQVFSDRP